MKKLTTILFVVAGMFLFGNLSVNAQEAQSRCPAMVKCMTFVGPDSYETKVEISDSAASLFLKYRIALENNGTKLVWLDECNKATKFCMNLDLTGRNPQNKVAQNNLNKIVKITSLQKSIVVIHYTEFDGDAGSLYLVKGKPVKMMPVE